MKKILLIITMAAYIMISGNALCQASVEWKGFQWNAYQAAQITVNDDMYLIVAPTHYNGGAAYYSTPIDFRSAKTPWIEVTFLDFLDDDLSSGFQLVMKNNYQEYTEIGAQRSRKNYVIYWYNYQSRNIGLVETSIVRTPGEHILKLGMQENGIVDYWIDDVRVGSTNKIDPDSFEDIYLAAQGSNGVFTDYQVGTDYRAPESVVEISIDIKPGGNPNSINLKSKGVVPVAILTTETFDATTLDPLSVRFGPNGAMETHGRGHMEDVDGDNDLDLVLHFKVQEIGIACGDITASLTAETFSEEEVEGADSISTIGCK
jgi:hypothetical protein